MAEITNRKRKSAPEGSEVKKRTRVTPTKAATKSSNLPGGAANQSQKVTRSSKKDAKPAQAPADSTATSKPEPKKKSLKKSEPTPPTDDAFAGFSSSDDEAAAPKSADQSALLAGFSSDSDNDEELPAAITKIPSLPDSAELQVQLKQAEADPDAVPGTIYIGRIPHGFYEPQMKAYFSQFGTITRLRLSRNKLTGRPKHFGFIEFESGAVAEIVAKTMDKYLMFGHILQVRRLRDEEIHPELWKGAGRRFKAMPRGQVEAGLLRRGTGREGWEKRVKKEEKRRKGRAAKLAELGYEFEMPELRKVESVPVQEVEKITVGEEDVPDTAGPAEVVEAVVEAATDATEDTPVVEQIVEELEEADAAGAKRKKGRKEKKVTKKVRLST
ncbi:hypothetical protein CAC42_6657 [Sphaceloma murrayae]|uniref:RRM domain-containing protein n=1 Tax=Sphaceloma murrayae TaxID=2082308 RepID=A0A2K1QG32_9PEZI|nr:hypothetical protein CAC42_6657 [Sphaceloma murrayae]